MSASVNFGPWPVELPFECDGDLATTKWPTGIPKVPGDLWARVAEGGATMLLDRRRRVVDALRKIAADPNETPRRRRIAERAVWDEYRGGDGVAMHLHPPGRPVVGNHRGGYFLHDDIRYEGGDDRG